MMAMLYGAVYVELVYAVRSSRNHKTINFKYFCPLTWIIYNTCISTCCLLYLEVPQVDVKEF